jgi:ankyrin repeat protein
VTLPMKCLCENNKIDCQACIEQAKKNWHEFSARNPGASPGQLMELAIEKDLPEVVFGILQNADLNINAVCDPSRYGSQSPMMTALLANNKRMFALITAQLNFDLASSLPAYEQWVWVRTCSLEMLLQYIEMPGVDINQKDGNGKALLHEVVTDLTSEDKLLALLRQPNVIIDIQQVDGTTPLYRAALAGNANAFEQLLDKGADINNRNNDNGWTSLMCAAAANYIAVAEKILSHANADINLADDNLNTALHIAARGGHVQIVELLLKRPDIQINLKNNTGATALAEAGLTGHAEVIKHLLGRSELDINSQDQNGQTPLFVAVSTGNVEIVRLLLADPRIDVTIMDKLGKNTALDMAKAMGFTKIIELMN